MSDARAIIMEHFIDCGNCGKNVHVSRHRKKRPMLCSECLRYVALPGTGRRSNLFRVMRGKGFMVSVTRPKSLRWGKNGRPLEKAAVRPIAIQSYDFGVAAAEKVEE